jgi:hypothetical protein
VAVLKGKLPVQVKAVVVMERMEIPLLPLVLPTQEAVGVEVDMQVVLEVLVAQAAQA